MRILLLVTTLFFYSIASADESKVIAKSLDSDNSCETNTHLSNIGNIHTQCWLSGNWNQQFKPRFQLALRVVEGESAANKSYTRIESTYRPNSYMPK